MEARKYNILIFSENPDQLMRFYRDTLGFKLESELKLDNDYGYMFLIADGYKLWIGKHSEVKGINKEPFRYIHNLYVDSVEKSYEAIKDKPGVTIVSKPQETPFSKPDNMWYVSTFLDPENNCWQFMGGK